jgi:hypothetical protein
VLATRDDGEKAINVRHAYNVTYAGRHWKRFDRRHRSSVSRSTADVNVDTDDVAGIKPRPSLCGYAQQL